MRIVSGIWGGRKISEPRGGDVTRPTTDRVREACASMVLSALEDGFDGVRVLDAFAGSGALGIEMLSRGASFCQFIDRDRGAAALVRRNLGDLSVPRGLWGVSCADALELARRGRVPGAPFGLVMLDPPYALGAGPVEELLASLAGAGSLASGALAVCEHAARDAGPRPAGFEVLREKRYGITAVDLLRYTSIPSGGDAPSGPVHEEPYE